MMARPIKWRRIENVPSVLYFAPADKEISGFPENILKLEELEAIRLNDLEGLEQGECADKMEISRQTFQRILLSARETIADCLINGKAIRIRGGNYTQNICRVRCLDCGNEWTESIENLEFAHGYTCPTCQSKNIKCGQSCSGKFGRGNCWRHGRMNR